MVEEVSFVAYGNRRSMKRVAPLAKRRMNGRQETTIQGGAREAVVGYSAPRECPRFSASGSLLRATQGGHDTDESRPLQ